MPTQLIPSPRNCPEPPGWRSKNARLLCVRLWLLPGQRRKAACSFGILGELEISPELKSILGVAHFGEDFQGFKPRRGVFRCCGVEKGVPGS